MTSQNTDTLLFSISRLDDGLFALGATSPSKSIFIESGESDFAKAGTSISPSPMISQPSMKKKIMNDLKKGQSHD